MKNSSLLLFFTFISLWSCELTEAQKWQQQAEKITIYRDSFGVPHIYGKTDADAVFGMLYAQCEDDFARIEQNYLWAIGRLSEAEGSQFLASDLRARLFMTEDEAKEYYNKSPKWLQKLCVAYADGINYYLYTHPETKPRLLTHFEPWFPFYFSEGSIGGDIEQIDTKAIGSLYKLPSTVAINDSESILAEPLGSNGFAISGKLTQSGKAMLLINPHTSFYFRGEMHVVSEEGLNAYGAVTWGQFFIYQGFNQHTGWMHTSSYADVIDEFVEKIDTTGPSWAYQYGEEKRPLEKQTVKLNFKEGDQVKNISIDIMRTHHGPITKKDERGFVSTALMWRPDSALMQSFLRNKMKGLTDLYTMMQYKSNSSNNTVYADDSGNIAYFHGNFIPRRDSSFDYTKPVDGSLLETDWKGLHSVEELIQVINPENGWIQNCNSTPFTSAGVFSPKGERYPSYMAPEPENFRGIHAVNVLDTLREVDLDRLISAAYDPYLPAFESVQQGIEEAFKAFPSYIPEIQPVIETLLAWDLRTDTASIAMTLAHFYLVNYLQRQQRASGWNFIEKVENFSLNTTHKERLDLLYQTTQQLVADFGKWDIAWGEVNRFQRLNGAINQSFDDNKESLAVGMASGNWGALASFGIRNQRDVKKLYGSYGNSFVAVVEFGERVKAKSILAGGQSADPNSPHFWDQARRYVDVDFKDVAFYLDEVEKSAKRKYSPGIPK